MNEWMSPVVSPWVLVSPFDKRRNCSPEGVREGPRAPDPEPSGTLSPDCSVVLYPHPQGHFVLTVTWGPNREAAESPTHIPTCFPEVAGLLEGLGWGGEGMGRWCDSGTPAV